MSRLPHHRAIALLATAATLVLASCDRKKEAEAPPVQPVLSLVVEPETTQLFGPFTGTVEPRYRTDLGFRTAGRMVSRNANVGDSVKKGDLLASLDASVARFGLASAKADLANSQAALANASRTEQRKTVLLQTGSTAQSQVDTAVADKDTANAKVNQSQASLVKAQQQLDFTDLHTDYDGVITSWALEVGQVVTPGQTVVTVAQPGVRDGVFDIPDDLLGKVQPGAKFSISLQADPTIAVPGEVREIAPESDTATRTRRIRLTLSDVPDGFRLGTTVTLTLKEPKPPTVMVPATAILDKDGHASVWLVSSNNTAVTKPVVLGARQNDRVTVTEGLAKGDRVITAGVHSLAEGQPIKLLEP